MTENRIRQLRLKKGLSQAQLAKAAQTSQQQIQRVEAGVQTVRFDLALRICAALDEIMSVVFPETKKPLKNAERRLKKASDIISDEQAAKSLESAGLDMDPEIWTFKYKVTGSPSGCLPISGADKHRLWSVMQNGPSVDFVVFDSEERRYAINLRHLQFCHFLFDPPFERVDEGDAEEDGESDEFGVLISLVDEASPYRFGVDPDTKEISDESADGLSVQMQDLFRYAELGFEERLTFTDEDGETIFLQQAAITMFSAPLTVVEPRLYSAVLEEADE